MIAWNWMPLTAALVGAMALAPFAHADGVPLDKAKLHGDEVIQTPIGDIRRSDV